jgi:hypothetical protein
MFVHNLTLWWPVHQYLYPIGRFLLENSMFGSFTTLRTRYGLPLGIGSYGFQRTHSGFMLGASVEEREYHSYTHTCGSALSLTGLLPVNYLVRRPNTSDLRGMTDIWPS